MSDYNQQYSKVISDILEKGIRKSNRTGVDTLVHRGPATITVDLNEGFPMITTCKKPFKLIAIELEGFLKGVTDKRWYQERNCHIWDEWASPIHKETLLPVGESWNEFQSKLPDLGPIYGYQWLHFNKPYTPILPSDQVQAPVRDDLIWDTPSQSNQLPLIFKKLKENPLDRRMFCSAWSPEQIDIMALPPCHLSFGLMYDTSQLHLTWTQRSADWALGVPFNMASYALLLSILCKLSGLSPGTVTGTFLDAHIYDNHIDGLREQLSRDPMKYSLPKLTFSKSYGSDDTPFDFQYADAELTNYESFPKIYFDVAV